MSTDVKAMIFDVIGHDTGASHVFSKVGTEAELAGTKTHKMRAVTGAALLGVTAAAVEFGKKSTEAYADVAKETAQLVRYTGMTATGASQLRFAAEETGVPFDKLSTSMKIFSKNLSATDGDVNKTTQMAQLLGTGWKDATGKMLPMNELLPKVAEHFKEMPDGPEKTAAALKIFGRGGADMVKILNKGSEGLAELAKESDKTGNTLSNVDSYKKQVQAQREMHAAMTGLEVQVGQALYPVIEHLTEFLAHDVGPAFSVVAGFVHNNEAAFRILTPIVVALAVAMGVSLAAQKAWAIGTAALRPIMALTTAATEAQTEATVGLDAAMDANPIGIVVLALAALAAGLVYAYTHSETFRAVVNAAFHGVMVAGSLLWGALKGYFKFIINLWLDVAGAIVHGAAAAFGWVPGLGPKLRKAADWFDDFRDSVNHTLNGVHDRDVSVTAHVLGVKAVDGLIDSISKVHNKDVNVTAHNHVTGGVGSLLTPHKATGGRLYAGHDYLVGEGGYERFRPDVDGMLDAHSAASRYGNGDADPGYVIVVVQSEDGKVLQQKLLRVKHDRGGKPLGLG